MIRNFCIFLIFTISTLLLSQENQPQGQKKDQLSILDRIIFLSERMAKLELENQQLKQKVEKLEHENQLQHERKKIDYESGWVYDVGHRDHSTIFTHKLGIIPSSVTILFSPTNPPTKIYPLLWTWGHQATRGPQTIEMTDRAIILHINGGSFLLRVWDPKQGVKQYASGYWKVLAWK